MQLNENTELSNLSKVVTKSGDVHVAYISRNELGQHKLVHAVSKDNEKTWEFTSDEEMQKFIGERF